MSVIPLRRDELLLCELHAHSRWSDGSLSIAGLVDLYAAAGFDVLCVTDHVVRGPGMVDGPSYGAYLGDITREAARARSLYDMLVIPGLELTWDDPDPNQAAHAVAIGVERFIGLHRGLEAALDLARSSGAAIVAAHPHDWQQLDPMPGRTTRRWSHDQGLRAYAHRFELINRHQVFGWVSAAGLPVVASGDSHLPQHLETWKTLIPAARNARAVVDFLRSPRPAYLSHYSHDLARESDELEPLAVPV